jgi:hypothetical protein
MPHGYYCLGKKEQTFCTHVVHLKIKDWHFNSISDHKHNKNILSSFFYIVVVIDVLIIIKHAWGRVEWSSDLSYHLDSPTVHG